MTKETFPSNQQVIDTFIPWNCEDGTKFYNVTKYEPICTTEDRKDCAQEWKTNANGDMVL